MAVGPKDFLDYNFSAISYNVLVGAFNAVRSCFGHCGVSSNCLLDYGKITDCKEAMSKYARLDDPVMTSPWEGLSMQSRVVLVAQNTGALRETEPGVVYPRADEYASKSLRKLGSKQAERSGESWSPRTSPTKKVV